MIMFLVLTNGCTEDFGVNNALVLPWRSLQSGEFADNFLCTVLGGELNAGV